MGLCKYLLINGTSHLPEIIDNSFYKKGKGSDKKILSIVQNTNYAKYMTEHKNAINEIYKQKVFVTDNKGNFVKTMFFDKALVFPPTKNEQYFLNCAYKKKFDVFLFTLDFDKNDVLKDFQIPKVLASSCFSHTSRSGRTKLTIFIKKDRYIDADRLAERICSIFGLPFAELDRSYGVRVTHDFIRAFNKFVAENKGHVVPLSARALMHRNDGQESLIRQIHRQHAIIEQIDEFKFLSHAAKVTLAAYIVAKKRYVSHQLFTELTGLSYKAFYRARKQLERLGLIQKVKEYKYKKYCAYFQVHVNVIKKTIFTSKEDAIHFVLQQLSKYAKNGSFNEFEWRASLILRNFMSESEFLSFLATIPGWEFKRERRIRAKYTFRWAKKVRLRAA